MQERKNRYLEFSEAVIAKYCGEMQYFSPIALIFPQEQESEADRAQETPLQILEQVNYLKEENHICIQNLSFLTNLFWKNQQQQKTVLESHQAPVTKVYEKEDFHTEMHTHIHQLVEQTIAKASLAQNQDKPKRQTEKKRTGSAAVLQASEAAQKILEKSRTDFGAGIKTLFMEIAAPYAINTVEQNFVVQRQAETRLEYLLTAYFKKEIQQSELEHEIVRVLLEEVKSRPQEKQVRQISVKKQPLYKKSEPATALNRQSRMLSHHTDTAIIYTGKNPETSFQAITRMEAEINADTFRQAVSDIRTLGIPDTAALTQDSRADRAGKELVLPEQAQMSLQMPDMKKQMTAETPVATPQSASLKPDALPDTVSWGKNAGIVSQPPMTPHDRKADSGIGFDLSHPGGQADFTQQQTSVSSTMAPSVPGAAKQSDRPPFHTSPFPEKMVFPDTVQISEAMPASRMSPVFGTAPISGVSPISETVPAARMSPLPETSSASRMSPVSETASLSVMLPPSEMGHIAVMLPPETSPASRMPLVSETASLSAIIPPSEMSHISAMLTPSETSSAARMSPSPEKTETSRRPILPERTAASAISPLPEKAAASAMSPVSGMTPIAAMPPFSERALSSAALPLAAETPAFFQKQEATEAIHRYGAKSNGFSVLHAENLQNSGRGPENQLFDRKQAAVFHPKLPQGQTDKKELHKSAESTLQVPLTQRQEQISLVYEAVGTPEGENASRAAKQQEQELRIELQKQETMILETRTLVEKMRETQTQWLKNQEIKEAENSRSAAEQKQRTMHQEVRKTVKREMEESVNQISTRVYHRLEEKLKSERNRRGMI